MGKKTKFITDPDDGLPVPLVNFWVEDKHEKLRSYCDRTFGPRRQWSYGGKYGTGSTFIDLFCSYGRCADRENHAPIPGSPLVAAIAAETAGAPFDEIYIADANSEALSACQQRMQAAGFEVTALEGKSEDTVERVVARIPKAGFHFAFLDPYNLGALPFSVIDRLATMKRMDMLIHVSLADINRNFYRYRSGKAESSMDRFAPGWRNEVAESHGIDQDRLNIINYWGNLLIQKDYILPDRFHVVKGHKSQPLYALALVARHKLAHKIWDGILTAAYKQRELPF